MVIFEDILDAAARGDTAAVVSWFEMGTRDPDFNGPDWTLLSAAALHDRCDTMSVILAHGADVNAGGPLHAAALAARYSAALLLFDHGVQVNFEPSAL